MSERKYSVHEVDALRRACEHKYLSGRYSLPVGGGGGSRNYKESDLLVAVEQMVRTHMIAGHTAQDLIDSEKRA